MKINKLALLFSLMITFGATKVFAQGVCVIGEKKVGVIQGVVIQADKQAILEAKVEVYRKSVEAKPIAEVKTDSDGRFSIPELSAGTYVLSASYPNFVRLVFPVRISKRANPKNELLVILGWNSDESCGGGEVLVKN